MRKIREVLRLGFTIELSARQIAGAVGAARSTVQDCLRWARAAGWSWPLPAELDEVALRERLHARPPLPSACPLPDFAAVHGELGRKGVTRLLLWQEYKARHPDGFGQNRPSGTPAAGDARAARASATAAALQTEKDG